MWSTTWASTVRGVMGVFMKPFMEHAHAPRNQAGLRCREAHGPAHRRHTARRINGFIGDIKPLPNEHPDEAILASYEPATF